MKHYKEATLTNVPQIVQTIRALRNTAKLSKVSTVKTQSLILRELPPDVLIAVAVELDKPTDLVAALSGSEGR